MSGDAANVQMTTTIDFDGMEGRLLDAERVVFTRFERTILKFIRGKWIGWEYKGRAKSAPRNVSFRAWASTLQTTDAPYSLHISNEARGYASKKPYVAYVHRVGETRPFYLTLGDDMSSEIMPAMKAALIAQMKQALEPRERKKLRSRGATERTVRTSAR
jgi:hypothetical protein